MAVYKGRKVRLGKPRRIRAGQTSYGIKKSEVFVRKPNGKIKRIAFGDPNMKIRKNVKSARKSFRARHDCDSATDRLTARYWSCRAW